MSTHSDTVQITGCRACSSERLEIVFDLHNSPLANRLLSEEQLHEHEPFYPLRLAFCHDCSLLQLLDTVAPEVLFRDYAYFSSVSDALLAHSQKHAERLIEARKLDPQSLVVEAASNDGYLLKNYIAHGIPVLGIEPATNIARVAEERGIPTLNEFFGRELGRGLRRAGRRADVFHANNVLAHVADLNGFVAGIEALLKPEGIAVLEFPYVKDLVDHVEFDTIYHEHLCYYSLTAVDRLFRQNGLRIVDVERLPIHGGSLRISAAVETSPERISRRVTELLQAEHAWGCREAAWYRTFGERVGSLRDALCTLLEQLKGEHKRIAAYGASAKGTTLLNYFGIGRETLEFVVDRSPAKQGKFTPGTHLKIHAPEALTHDRPDYVLLLTWNFADEILAQQAEFRRQGGKFIIPIPELKVA
jgi:hypothetical protein